MSEENLYERFLAGNQTRINRALNRILWLTFAVGPVISIGVYFGYFESISYHACILASVILFALALIHTYFIKIKPDSETTKYVVLMGIQIALFWMNRVHMGIYLTWFLIPLISLLYCDKRTFLICGAISYLSMFVSVYLDAPYEASLTLINDAQYWFRGMMGGFSIEYFFMMVGGLYVCRLITEQLNVLYGSSEIISRKDQEIFQDRLTGLWNKKYVEAMYNNLVSKEGKDAAFFILDLDNFKLINDEYGHLDGDEVLVDFSDVLRRTFKDYDDIILSRFGGDEFIALIPNMKGENELCLMLDKLMCNAKETFEESDKYADLTLSLGATFASKNATYGETFNQADNSLRFVKRNGKNMYHIFHKGDMVQAPLIGR